MLADALAAVVGEAHVLTGDDALADHSHDEALSITWRRPCAVVRPGSTAEVSAILRLAAEGAPVVGSRPAGCGHAGDGNVHLSVLEPDDDTRHRLLGEVFRAGRELDGPISGEHGVGRSERRHHRELTGPATLALLARAKAAFDPHGILNPDISPSSEDTT
jgi:FAD/FMN-containing dehydrogenase